MDELINPLEQLDVTEFKYSPEIIKLINNDLPGFVNGSISDLVECEKKKQAAIKSADGAKNVVDQAVRNAKNAKDLSTGLFKNGKAIEALKIVTESEATALDEISKAQCDQAEALRVIFENQKKQAIISRNLCLLGMGNQAVANTVLKRLKEGIEQGELNSISEDVFQEFERIVMWWSQVEDMNAKIRSYEQRVAEIQTEYENVQCELSAIDKNLKEEIDIRQHSIDTLQKDMTSNINAVNENISAANSELRKEYGESTDAIDICLKDLKTACENELLNHSKQFGHLRDDYFQYKGQFIHKKAFKSIVLIVSLLALILSVISLII